MSSGAWQCAWQVSTWHTDVMTALCLLLMTTCGRNSTILCQFCLVSIYLLRLLLHCYHWLQSHWSVRGFYLLIIFLFSGMFFLNIGNKQVQRKRERDPKVTFVKTQMFQNCSEVWWMFVLCGPVWSHDIICHDINQTWSQLFPWYSHDYCYYHCLTITLHRHKTELDTFTQNLVTKPTFRMSLYFRHESMSL